ncbi:MAG: efflux RND transporter permease subunit, partial [Paramuribaculum sp.]
VSVIGGDVAEYQIRLSQDRMKHLGVSLDEVRQAVEGINSNRSGGVLYDYGNEYLITVDMHTAATEQLAKSVIRSDERGIVTIADVADVTMGTESPKLGTASERTKPAVLLTVAKQPSTSTIDLTDGIETTLNELKQSLPAGINISTDIFRQSDFIDNSISNLQTSLLEGALFVIIVLFVFLMNFRTTLISVVALPISIIVTILLLNAFGLTINTMSLGGIAIAIGSLVDDAIVDVENVYRRLRINAQLPEDDRLTTREVVFEASREVRLPILNSTLIIAASFMPLFFLDGIGGRMLIPLGISFITALAASTVVALTVTPALCSFLLGNKGYNRKLQRDPGITRVLVKAYRRSLSAVMRHRIMALAVTGVLLAGALVCFFMAGHSFLPSFNEGSLTINVSTLPGISLEESDRIGREAERIILSMPEIKTTARKTGRAELDEHSLGINVSEIEAPYTLSGRSREEMVRDLRHKLSHLPGTNIEIGQPISHRIDAMLSGTEAQIAIKIFGSDLETLHNLATGIRHSISEIDGIVDVAVEQQTARPQIDIRPRRDMLARYGITNGHFASAVATLLGGEQVAQVYTDGIPYNITLKADHGVTGRLDDISQIMIDSREGKIPLSYVADVVSTSGPNTINRENANRRIVVSANVDGRDLKGAVSDIQKSIGSSVKLPEGYFIKYGGQFESEEAASRTLAIASLAALIVIFILLLQEYHNIAQSAVILVNMPLALIGGIFALELTGSEINIPATIGFISLMGIATRGGMLLMSHYNALEKNGVPLYDRIVKGSSDRLNPIVMTALTSALALIPLALRGGQPGNEIQSPMAVVILGGLFSSTLLNLYIVPILYAYISSRNRKKK